jgi:hypothetical protein
LNGFCRSIVHADLLCDVVQAAADIGFQQQHGDVSMVAARTPRWTWAWPALAWLIVLLTAFFGATGLVAAMAGVALLGSVFAAVYHAEVVADRVGEPFGTLVLALAVTVIETALIVSVMLTAPAHPRRRQGLRHARLRCRPAAAQRHAACRAERHQ